MAFALMVNDFRLKLGKILLESSDKKNNVHMKTLNSVSRPDKD